MSNTLSASVEASRLAAVQLQNDINCQMAENQIIQPKGAFSVHVHDAQTHTYRICTNAPSFFPDCRLADYFGEIYCTYIEIDDECNIVVKPYDPMGTINDLNYLIQSFDRALVYVPAWEAFQAMIGKRNAAFAEYQRLSEEADKLYQKVLAA